MFDSSLNIFQRLTRRWESIHPYNAAQIMRLGGQLELGRATEIWGEALRGLGLGTVEVLSNHRFHHEPINGELARYPVRGLPADANLEGYLSAELNRRFDDPDEPPFRPFLLQRPEEFYFGVVYQHWVADSVSIRAILQEWFRRVFDPTAPRPRPLRQPEAGYWRLFATHNRWRLDEAFGNGTRLHLRHRRARKVRTAGQSDYPVRVSFHQAPPGLICHVRSYARRHRVKVQDVLLAALAQLCAEFVPAQVRKNRPDLSVGSILDLRRHAQVDLSNTFGLFLGFTNVVCRRQHLGDWPALLRSVASQNLGHRQHGPAQSSLMWMLGAMTIDRFVPDRELYHFYRKELPMLGGLSNVNLNDTWTARFHPNPLRQYIRVSPTGPLVPLVFSTTTLSENLSFALTCRNSLLPAERSSAMADAFIDRLRQIA